MDEALVPNVRALATTRLSNALLARVKAATKDRWIVYILKICDLIIMITCLLMNSMSLSTIYCCYLIRSRNEDKYTVSSCVPHPQYVGSFGPYVATELSGDKRAYLMRPTLTIFTVMIMHMRYELANTCMHLN